MAHSSRHLLVLGVTVAGDPVCDDGALPGQQSRQQCLEPIQHLETSSTATAFGLVTCPFLSSPVPCDFLIIGKSIFFRTDVYVQQIPPKLRLDQAHKTE